MNEKQLSPAGFVRAAAKFKILADPTRLKILDLLRIHGQLNVGEIGTFLDCSQPTASRQLAKLFDAHMISRRRETNCVVYFIEDDSIFQLCEAICGRIEREDNCDVEELYETEVG